MLKNSGIVFVLIMLFISSCRKTDTQVVSIVKDNYTIKEQKTLGVKLDEAYQSDFNILPESSYGDAYSYLTTLYDMIIRTPSVDLRDSLDWQVMIIDDASKMQVFVSPSGTIYLSTGLLEGLSAENQLVALMANQVYYLESGAAFDLVKDRNDRLEVGKVVLGESSTQIDMMANTLLFTSYPVDVVKQADEFQVDLLCPFKYNSTGMIDVYYNEFLSSSLEKTMPWSNERAANIALVSQGCGENDSLFVVRYADFKENDLPL